MKQIIIIIFTVMFFQLTYGQGDKLYLNLSYAEIDSLMMVYYHAGNYSAAIPVIQEGKNRSALEFGKMDSIYTVYTNDLALFYKKMGNYTEAEKYFKESRSIRKRVLGEEHPNYSSSLNNLAAVYKDLGKYKEAASLFLESKEIRKRVLGEEHPDYSSSLNNLAAVYQDLGKYKEAESLFLESKRIRKKVLGEEHKDYANVISNLAVLYYNMGLFEKAEPLYLEAKEIQKKILGEDDPNYGVSLNNIANLYEQMGRYSEAELLYQATRNNWEKSLGKEHPLYAICLNNMAVLYGKMERYPEAVKLHLEVKSIRKNTLGEDHPEYAKTLSNLARVYKSTGKYEESEKLYLEALRIHKKIHGEKHLTYAKDLNSLSIFYVTTNEFSKALPLAEEFMAIVLESVGERHYLYLKSLNNLSDLHFKLRDYAQAWDYSHRALAANCQINRSGNINAIWADSLKEVLFISLEDMLETLKNMYFLLGVESSINSKGKQVVISKLAMHLLKRTRNSVSNTEDKLRVLSENVEWTDWALEVLDKENQVSQAFSFAEQSKSVLLMDASKATKAFSFGYLPDSLMEEEEVLQNTYSDISAQLLEQRTKAKKDSLTKELANLNASISLFKKKVETNYPEYIALKQEEKEIDLKDIQAKLGEHTALIEYVISDSLLHIMYIDKQNAVWEKRPIDKQSLKVRITKLHAALSNYDMLEFNAKLNFDQYTSEAYWFYKELLAPVLQKEKKIKELVIISDGELGHLPFEAFLTKKTSSNTSSKLAYKNLHYLLQDYQISYHYSARLWLEAEKTRASQNNHQILAMAPNYEKNIYLGDSLNRLSKYFRIRKTLAPLPSARREVELLSQSFDGFFGFDENASEKIFKEKAAKFSIIHLAMHGLLDSENQILSSFVFSEDDDSLENNFLQAYEISKMNLNADLVVLSACETGFGEFEKGNGIASLARAFTYAGASSLIVSLWQVNDYATSGIMKNLYENLASGMKTDEALRYAKLEYIKTANGSLAHPAYWSPFIQIGNTQPVHIKRKSSGAMPWIIGGIIAILILGGFMLTRRKKETE